ncbi:hypothetical protein HA402_001831 [Bradysia odoriphaga]|nr:hypothetical protein HA402_001831 [Bradysia odoriphaga]
MGKLFKINKSFLPIKAHYFFFMAAIGPILPQLPVIGKQLGISADIMGLITSVLPILYILAKPAVGYLMDYFTRIRKVIFIAIILIMTLSYAGFYIVPSQPEHKVHIQAIYNFSSINSMETCNDIEFYTKDTLCTDYRPVKCRCETDYLTGFLTSNNEIVTNIQEETDNISATSATPFTDNQLFQVCLNQIDEISNKTCHLVCHIDEASVPDCVTGTATFWMFVFCMCLGTICFNCTNSATDATCFDILGDDTMKYGAQRVWGTIGFGVSALIAGVAVQVYSSLGLDTLAPPLFIMLVFSSFDVISVNWLELPNMSSSESIYRDVIKLLRHRRIAVFLVFATLAGILDSFIIYFMFWHLEEVAQETGFMESIKLIEGCVVAAECLGGEILFFLISGKILKKIGYVHCLSFCFLMYSLRLGLISLLSNPWHLVVIEFFMQGCSYALCYTCIVAYASAIAPPGTTATVQGLVAGMDDGIGFAIGSLIGGQMFQRLGGAISFRIFSISSVHHMHRSLLFATINEI